MHAQPGQMSSSKGEENSSKVRCVTEGVTGKSGAAEAVPVTPSGEQRPRRRIRRCPPPCPLGAKRLIGADHQP